MSDYSIAAEELYDLIDSDFESKVEKSLDTIEDALVNSKRPIISSSFGKDSIVLIHLVHRIDNSVPIVMNDTGVMFPETLQYKREMEEKWNLNVDVVKPDMTFFEIVDEYEYPKTSRSSESGNTREPKCCKILKTDPMQEYIKENDIDLDFVGLCAYEGRQRKWAYIRTGKATYEHKAWGVKKSIPLIWWELDDIWQYIEKHNIPKNPAYEKYDTERTGCITCTGHKNWEQSVANYSFDLLKMLLEEQGEETYGKFYPVYY